MAWSDYFNGTTGLTYYAKPIPVVESPWATDVIPSGAEGFSGEYPFSGLTDGVDYAIFIQAGGSPASSDVRDGSIYYRADVSADIATLEALVTSLTGEVNTLQNLLTTTVVSKLTDTTVKNISLYVEEAYSYVLQTDYDLSAIACKLVVEDDQKNTISEIDFSSKDSNSVTFPTVSLTDDVAQYIYSIRDTTTDKVYQRGKVFVRYSPTRTP